MSTLTAKTTRFGASFAIAAVAFTGVGTASVVFADGAQAASCVSSDRVKIKLGFRGIDSVKEAQCRLNKLGNNLEVDGVFGKSTDKAVRAFQSKNGLTSDGVVGTKTWDKLVAKTGGGGGDSSRDEKVKTVVNYAKDQLGKPYLRGATGPDKFDCSGLTQSAYKKVGITLKRKSTAQHTDFKRVSASDRKAGDLIWWDGIEHVGIYIGDGQIIDASGSKKEVAQRNVYTYSGKPAQYYRVIP